VYFCVSCLTAVPLPLGKNLFELNLNNNNNNNNNNRKRMEPAEEIYLCAISSTVYLTELEDLTGHAYLDIRTRC
jgi:hypothetical protein